MVTTTRKLYFFLGMKNKGVHHQMLEKPVCQGRAPTSGRNIVAPSYSIMEAENNFNGFDHRIAHDG